MLLLSPYGKFNKWHNEIGKMEKRRLIFQRDNLFVKDKTNDRKYLNVSEKCLESETEKIKEERMHAIIRYIKVGRKQLKVALMVNHDTRK